MQAADATWRLNQDRVEELYRRAGADRWHLSRATFGAQLELSVARAFPETPPDRRDLDRYLSSLHLEDLALACACAEGIESAWDHFVAEYRPALYRAADAIDRSGAAREWADSLYGELFGLTSRDGQRRSHFRYFHGRSSLATWLRAVLAQRYVDGIRRTSRLDPLPADEGPDAIVAPPATSNPEHRRYLELLPRTLATTIAALQPRDRLRLQCYYSQDLTLAQIGRALGEHEATVSRNLARTRRNVRAHVEAALRAEGMGEAEIGECLAVVVDDPGSLDLADVLGDDATTSKKSRSDRSK